MSKFKVMMRQAGVPHEVIIFALITINYQALLFLDG